MSQINASSAGSDDPVLLRDCIDDLLTELAARETGSEGAA